MQTGVLQKRGWRDWSVQIEFSVIRPYRNFRCDDDKTSLVSGQLKDGCLLLESSAMCRHSAVRFDDFGVDCWCIGCTESIAASFA